MAILPVAAQILPVACLGFYLISHIVANMRHANTYSPVAFRSVHTGIEPPFLLKIYYVITACMTRGLYIQKILTKRKMMNCQKINLLLFFTLNSVTTGV